MKSLKIIVFSVCVLVVGTALNAYAQENQHKADSSDAKKTEEQKKKKLKAVILKLVKKKSFVITVDRLYDDQLKMYVVNSNTNFVKLNGGGL